MFGTGLTARLGSVARGLGQLKLDKGCQAECVVKATMHEPRRWQIWRTTHRGFFCLRCAASDVAQRSVVERQSSGFGCPRDVRLSSLQQLSAGWSVYLLGPTLSLISKVSTRSGEESETQHIMLAILGFDPGALLKDLILGGPFKGRRGPSEPNLATLFRRAKTFVATWSVLQHPRWKRSWRFGSQAVIDHEGLEHQCPIGRQHQSEPCTR